MKKPIVFIFVLLLTINLIGCNSNKNFEYEIRKEYQGKIRENLAETFIDFTKDMENVYDGILDKTEIMNDEELDLVEYMLETVSTYRDFLVDMNIYEEKIFEIMEEQLDIMVDILTTRTEYHQVNEEEQEEESLKENLLEIKKQIENNFEKVKIYME